MTRIRPYDRLALLAVVPLFVGLLAGCSSGGDSAPASSSASSADGTEQQQYEAWNVKLRACLTEKGVDVPADPKQSLPFSDEMKEFMAACQEEVGAPPSTGSDLSDEELIDGVVKMNACLRERGYEVEDPTPGEPVKLPTDITKEDIQACNQFAG